jgi:hypothetical protein
MMDLMEDLQIVKIVTSDGPAFVELLASSVKVLSFALHHEPLGTN